MTESEARQFLTRNHRGVVATLKHDGRPQLSNVVYAVADDGRIKISTTRDRAKTANVRRDPRCSLLSLDDNFAYVVAEGTAELIEGLEAAAELRWVYRNAAGREHPNWQEFDEAMVREGRLVLAIRVERLYPVQA